MFREHYNIPLVHVDARERFLGALELIPASLSTLSTIGLWAYALGFVIWGLSGLRRTAVERLRLRAVLEPFAAGLGIYQAASRLPARLAHACIAAAPLHATG